MEGTLSVSPSEKSRVVVWDEKREDGRAIMTTPAREIIPAICSMRVKGSWRRMEQAQQATIGARNVITVASPNSRYCRESIKQMSIQVLS